MTFRQLFAALLLSLLSFGVVYAAGSPINEDFTTLLTISDKMLAAAKNKDAAAFDAAASEASAAAKDQGLHGNSPTLQRVSTKFKMARIAVKKGNFDKGAQITEEAVAQMKQDKAPLKFGGGS